MQAAWAELVSDLPPLPPGRARIVLGKRSGDKGGDHAPPAFAGIYAAGDVTGRDQFVYMAAYGA